MEKKELRALVKQLKQELSQEQKLHESKAVFDYIESMDIFKQAQSILLYHSLPDELPTHHIINKWAETKQIYLPRVNGDDLDILPYDSSLTDDNRFHIFEPTGTQVFSPNNLDIIIVPAVALDKRCNRMGRGKGFYDRLLNGLTHPYTIGVGFSCQLFETIPCEPHDKRLNAVITPDFKTTI